MKDGGGVTPDSVMMPSKLHDFVYDLILSREVHDFIVRYCNTRTLPPFEAYALSDADYDEFKQFILDSSFSYKPRSLHVLDALDEAVKKEELNAASELQALRTLLTPNVADEIDRHKETISPLLTLLIVRTAYAEAQSYEAKYKQDEVLKQTLDLLRNPEACEDILKM